MFKKKKKKKIKSTKIYFSRFNCKMSQKLNGKTMLEIFLVASNLSSNQIKTDRRKVKNSLVE